MLNDKSILWKAVSKCNNGYGVFLSLNYIFGIFSRLSSPEPNRL